VRAIPSAARWVAKTSKRSDRLSVSLMGAWFEGQTRSERAS
jgi:hypothetical protein